MAEVTIKLNDLSNDDKNNLVGTSGSSVSTKIQIVPAQPKTLTHLPTRPSLELAFKNLAYRVKEGRSNSEFRNILTAFNFKFCYSIYLKCLETVWFFFD